MSLFNNAPVRFLISLIAIANIVAMMGFEYGLPNLAVAVRKETAQEAAAQTEVGTIEAVEKEEASKETEAAESALAKTEEEEPVETVEERDPDEPLLELTDDSITLKVGERFNYMSYIETMQDVDGSDLSRYIHLDKEVNTWEPGEIELTYRITSTITGKSSSKVLYIIIEE